MASGRPFYIVAALIASQALLAVSVRADICQELVVSPVPPDRAQLCSLATSLRDLGCLCGTNGEALKAAPGGEMMAQMTSCFDNEQDLCNVMAKTDLVKQFSIPYVTGVVKLPGLGFIQTSALSDLPALDQQSTNEVADTRPVLDLSALQDNVAVDIELDASSNAELVLTQDSSIGDEMSFDIDIGIPRTFLDNGGELDLDFDLGLNDDVDITVDSDFEIDATISMGSSSDNFGSVHLEASAVNNGRITKDFVEQALPTAFESALSAQDAVLEMDIEISGNLQSSDAIITVRDEDSNVPISGEEVGRLLTVISEWLQTSENEGAATQRGALRGVSKLLADVGTQVGDIMPDESLHSGQVLEIYAEASPQKPSRSSPCMLSALAAAAQSITTARNSDDQGHEQSSCSVCAFVNKHLSLLWCLIILCSLYVSYTLLVSFCNYLWPAEDSPSLEADDLKKPLILHAADFADSSSKSRGLQDAVWEPYCGPVKSQADNHQ